jgi:outer membrane protein assembly factor BamD
MTQRFNSTPFVSILLAVTAACASGPRLEQFDAEGLFAHATQLARQEKWPQAIEAFQRFTFEYATHPRYQEARFQLAESYFSDEQYITAANEYARLADEFPAGPWVDDSRFKVCESYYRLSPRVELDQEYTAAALEHCQSLLAYHPGSPFEDRARTIITEMREKLAEKLFATGAYYERRGATDSAILYFEKAVAEQPATATAARALARLIRIYNELEYEQEGQSARERLLRDYPDSPEARALQGTSA